MTLIVSIRHTVRVRINDAIIIYVDKHARIQYDGIICVLVGFPWTRRFPSVFVEPYHVQTLGTTNTWHDKQHVVPNIVAWNLSHNVVVAHFVGAGIANDDGNKFNGQHGYIDVNILIIPFGVCFYVFMFFVSMYLVFEM